MNCKQCGATLSEDAKFCTSCGAKHDENQEGKQVAVITENPSEETKKTYTSSNSKDEKPSADSPYAVMGTGSFLGTLILMFIPILGLILAIVWACGGTKKENKRNLARAYLILMLIGIILLIPIFIIGGIIIGGIISEFNPFKNGEWDFNDFDKNFQNQYFDQDYNEDMLDYLSY